ncbi:MAG: CVNH domain-containing protein [Cyanobacteria bacterium P01_A01_bin.45]
MWKISSLSPKKFLSPVIAFSLVATSAIFSSTLNQAIASQPEANRFYTLTTRFLEKENKCLEGNKLARGSTLNGAAFMDNCQNVTGQHWKFVPAGNDYFRLQTKFLEKDNKCLEGNKLARGSTLNGAAFMDNCQNVTGQLWKLVPAGNGYFRLQTKFLEKENKCLEGNKVARGSTLNGAAFMDNCQNVTGQLWKFKPVSSNTVKKREVSSYQKSCRNISIRGNLLSASCRTIRGSYKNTKLTLLGIQNIDGVLKYEGNPNAKSSYQKSCRNISISGNRLSASCRTIRGSYKDTRLTLLGIENIDGVLKYTS